MTTHMGSFSFSAHIPPAICAKLKVLGKEQRNTQAELLAVLVLAITFPEQLRAADMLLWEDNTPAMGNVVSGAATDPDSQAIVGAIWLTCAVLGANPRVEWVASESNPADAFSRPDEPQKQREARRLSEEFGLQPTAARWPASLRMDAAAWAAAVVASDPGSRATDGRRTAQLAAEMNAVDEHTLYQVLAATTIDAADGQVTLGWMRSRGRGIVAAATHRHLGLARLLAIAARPHLGGDRCTTIVLRRGALPITPADAIGRPRAVCVTQPPGQRAWATTPAQLQRSPPPPGSVCAAFYALPAAGIHELRRVAPLQRPGLAVLA